MVILVIGYLLLGRRRIGGVNRDWICGRGLEGERFHLGIGAIAREPSLGRVVGTTEVEQGKRGCGGAGVACAPLGLRDRWDVFHGVNPVANCLHPVRGWGELRG